MYKTVSCLMALLIVGCVHQKAVRLGESSGSWQYVHDGTRLIVTPFESESQTYTRYVVEYCSSQSAATNSIVQKGLLLTTVQSNECGFVAVDGYGSDGELTKSY